MGDRHSSRDAGGSVAMELKPIEALKLWFDVVSDSVRDDGPDLSSRQTAILLTV